MAEGSYACLIEPEGILFESPRPEAAPILRRLVETQTARLFELPGELASGGPPDDLFEGCEGDEFFLAFMNDRVGLVVACPEAEPLQSTLRRPLKVLADRLFRFKQTYQLDSRGGGFFFNTPRLDLVVIGRKSLGA